MDCSLVINVIPCDSFLGYPLEGKNSLEWLLASIEKYCETMPLFFLDSKKTPHELSSFCEGHPHRQILLAEESSSSILEALKKVESRYFIWVEGDAPFLDFQTTLLLLEQHRHYGVQLTNCDGYPLGLLPEILSSEILPALLALVETGKSTAALESGATFFELLSPEVNQFDIETHLPPKDFNLLRLCCKTKTKRNSLFCERIAKAITEQGKGRGALPIADELLTILEEHPLWYRTVPAYYSLQIINQNIVKNPIYPWQFLAPELQVRQEGDPLFLIEEAQLKRLCQEALSLSGDAVFCFNHWGESSLHPQVEQLIDLVLSEPQFTLLIETSALGWNEAILRRLAQKYPQRLIWIVELCYHQKALYDQAMGEGFFEEAWKQAHLLSELFPGNCYCQAFRIKEQEEDLLKFWKYWKEKGQPLVQKYDHFCGLLPDRRVVDLSPVKRFPCWHLKRDLSLWANGVVSFCKEDIDLTRTVGSFLEESLESLFQKIGELYEKDCKAQYDNRCGRCDEFYTFNF